MTPKTETDLRIMLASVLPLIEEQLGPNSYAVRDIKAAIKASYAAETVRNQELRERIEQLTKRVAGE